jgi:Protein of unknown function (DUF2924)
LAGASRADLASRWRALYETEPPRRISRELLKRALDYRLQELALGGLKPATRRLLARVAADALARRPIALSPARTLTPGTVLLRNWHGTEHQMIVREQGVEFQGNSTSRCPSWRGGAPAASGTGAIGRRMGPVSRVRQAKSEPLAGLATRQESSNVCVGGGLTPVYEAHGIGRQI